MPNEFKVKNGLLVDSGSTQITGSLFVSGGVSINTSGSIFTTASSTVFSVDGASGRLFQIDDTLSGSLYSVNTIAGLPVMEVFSDNTVRIGQYGKKALYVSQSAVGVGKEAILLGVLDVSGSVFVTGSVNATSYTGSLFGTASYVTGSIHSTGNLALSASYAITASYSLNAGGGGGLTTKAGSVANTSFTGNPKTATVTFTSAFANTSYAIVVTGEDARSWTVQTKQTTGFVINTNSNTSLTGTTYWIATVYGES